MHLPRYFLCVQPRWSSKRSVVTRTSLSVGNEISRQVNQLAVIFRVRGTTRQHLANTLTWEECIYPRCLCQGSWEHADSERRVAKGEVEHVKGQVS